MYAPIAVDKKRERDVFKCEIKTCKNVSKTHYDELRSLRTFVRFLPLKNKIDSVTIDLFHRRTKLRRRQKMQ